MDSSTADVGATTSMDHEQRGRNAACKCPACAVLPEDCDGKRCA
jgi:hypothetical protein